MKVTTSNSNELPPHLKPIGHMEFKIDGVAYNPVVGSGWFVINPNGRGQVGGELEIRILFILSSMILKKVKMSRVRLVQIGSSMRFSILTMIGRHGKRCRAITKA